jgi:recombination protein RecA
MTLDDFDDDKALDDALEIAVKQIHKKFGAGSLFAPGQDKADLCRDVLKTNIIPWDRILGGGFVKGCIVEMFGPESAGKTTLTLEICAEVQRYGGRVLPALGRSFI